jgi:hypothetical protein
METKKCSKCLKELSLTQFYKDSTNSDGYCCQCKICKNSTTKERREKNKIKNLNIELPKNHTCVYCKETKINTEFSKTLTNKSGLSLYCKKCSKIVRDKQSTHKKEINIIVDNTINKKCTVCNLEKILSQFKTNLKSNDNFSNICIDCSPKSEWTVEKQRASDKKYRLNNPEKMREKYKKQSLNNNRRIRDSLNHRISEALKSNKNRKSNKTIEYIGCDINFFKSWIEYQFTENMSFDNYGQWHLDHVKPCASFDLNDNNQILECFNWKNYQPLWKKDNLIKSNKIDEKLINEHKNKINNYILTLNSAENKEGDLLE